VKIHQTINGSFKNFILEHLHHHTIINMCFDEFFEAHHAQILSCLGFRVGAWFITLLIFPIFSTSLRMWLGLTHLLIASFFQCVCTHPIDPMGIHLLCCAHDNECMGTHDAIHNIFVAIVQDIGLFVEQEQLHALLSAMFTSSY